MKQRKVTLRQVAANAGVSLATASRALSGDPRCRAKTRERVKAVATRLVYVPDPGVAALARRRAGGVGNKYPLAWLWERRNAPAGEAKRLLESVRAEAEARGYTLELARLPELGGAKAAARVLTARGVVGCFVPSLDRTETVEEFGWERFSVVSFLQENFALPFDTVRPDMFYLMFHAWERARAAGGRRIGAVIPSSVIARENELLLSACAYHQSGGVKAGAKVPPLILKPDASGKTKHYTAETAAWFARYRPDFVIGKTEGAYWSLVESGWRSPQDFQCLTLRRTDARDLVAGFDWELPVLAEAMMSRMHALVSMGVRGRRETPGTWVTEGRWRRGESAPAINA